MIETILSIKHFFDREIKTRKFFLELEWDIEYYLKIEAIVPPELNKKINLGHIDIYSLIDHIKILDHDFFIKDTKKFKFEIDIDNFELFELKYIEAVLSYDFPNIIDDALYGFIIFIEIKKINNELLDNLKVKSDKLHELYKLIDRFLNDDYIGIIADIGVFAEYIALEITKKINKKPSNFRTAVNNLCNYQISKKTKINYNYLGSLLWPLYYIRNQKSHAYPLIEFNKYLSSTLFSILSEIIRYISEKGIQL